MIAEIGFSAARIIESPAEDVEWVDGPIDLCFTSPPYFNIEHYSDEPTQSCNRYRTSQEWVEGFFIPMLKLQYGALEPDAINALNFNAEQNKKTQGIDCIELAESIGFKHLETLRYPIAGAWERQSEASEPVYIFQKPWLTN
jgi:hypothetical protein